MLLFVIVQIILLLIVIGLFYLLSWFWPPDAPWAPWWTTSKDIARIMCRLAKVKKTDVVYDLGCGEGNALLVCAQEYGARGVGVEIDPLRVWLANWKIKIAGLTQKVTIIKNNFFRVNISPANVVFVYLVPKTLETLKEKFLKGLRPGSRIISYRYPILYLPLIAEDKEKEIFVYEIPTLAKSKEPSAKSRK